MDTVLYHARNIRSANCIIVKEPMLMISGHDTRNTSAYPPGRFHALDDVDDGSEFMETTPG